MSTRSATKEDGYYGHAALAIDGQNFVCSLFNCPSVYCPSDDVPSLTRESSSTGKGRGRPELAKFIGYAMYRAKLPVEVVYLAYLLLYRLKLRFPDAEGKAGHRLFLCAYMIASKSICDDVYSTESWTIIGSDLFSKRELSTMESEMLVYLEWKINARHVELQNFKVWFEMEAILLRRKHKEEREAQDKIQESSNRHSWSDRNPTAPTTPNLTSPALTSPAPTPCLHTPVSGATARLAAVSPREQTTRQDRRYSDGSDTSSLERSYPSTPPSSSQTSKSQYATLTRGQEHLNHHVYNTMPCDYGASTSNAPIFVDNIDALSRVRPPTVGAPQMQHEKSRNAIPVSHRSLRSHDARQDLRDRIDSKDDRQPK